MPSARTTFDTDLDAPPPISPRELQVQLSRWHGYGMLVDLLDRRLEAARVKYETTVPASEFLRARVIEIRAFRQFILDGDHE